MPDPDAEAIRRALEGDDGPEPESISADTPLATLRAMAANGPATVRVQAAKVLLDRDDRERERRRQERGDDPGADAAAVRLAREIREMPEEELDRELEGVLTVVERPPADLQARIERRAHELARTIRKREEQQGGKLQQIAESATAAPDEDDEPGPPPLPPQMPDDPELARQMLEARERGENPFDLPGTVTRSS